MMLKEILDCASHEFDDRESFTAAYNTNGCPVDKREDADTLAELIVRLVYLAHDPNHTTKEQLIEVLRYLEDARFVLGKVINRFGRLHDLLHGSDDE